jgi:formate hydrogenlyase transcriptional activator
MKASESLQNDQSTATENALRRAVDTTPALIHTARPDGYLDYFNRGWLDFLGKSLEDVCGWRWTESVHPEDVAGIVQKWHAALASEEPFEAEARVRRADGTYRALLHRKVPLHDEQGNIVKWFGSSVDIEDRKCAEQKIAEKASQLERSEFYLREGERLAHVGSWSLKPDGIFDYWSPETFVIFGFDPGNGIPTLREWLNVLHPVDRDAVYELIRRMFSEGVNGDIQYRIDHPKHGQRTMHSTGEPVFENGKVTRLIGNTLDITERKWAEEELRASERKYRDLVDTTPAFVHTALPNGDVDFYNRGWLEYVGLPLTDLLGWGWTCMIHPEDVETIVPKWRAALEAGEPFVAESRVRRADGEYRWFLHREEPLRNEAGEIVKWYGSSIEIQERKIAEQRIREQETELRQILDLTPQHIGVLAPDGSRLYVNHTALEYFGITLEQWREPGRVPNSLAHPEDREHFLYERKKRFLEGKPHEFEARLLRHDGEFRWFLFRQTPLKDERGHITRWYGTATDIEDRKRAEEEIRKENIALREELGKTSMFEEVIGTSLVLQMVLARAAKVAPTDSTVLIMGETGTGKELIARAIHKRSKRSERPFISVNCAAVPSSLIMSELFGHEKGAFTGAVQRRLGRFELAEGGTIFLDEVGDLPMETQIALLRVLQEREFERVGGTEVLRADVRVISATNRDLQAAIADGAFRSDLYYRLNVFPIKLPPLRERKEDVPLLVNYFVDRYAKRAGKKIKHIQKKTLDALQEYSWPGNVRELQNVIERSLIIGEANEFSIDKSWVANEPQPSGAAPADQKTDERKRIEAALAQSNGKIAGASGAAAKLGIPASTLESKIRSLRINKFQFKGV